MRGNRVENLRSEYWYRKVADTHDFGGCFVTLDLAHNQQMKHSRLLNRIVISSEGRWEGAGEDVWSIGERDRPCDC